MDLMDLSINPLSKQQKAFLESKNLLGFNKSQYQDDITERLDKSLRYLYHIIDNPSNLKKLDLYDKLNAQTLEEIIGNLLLDFDSKSRRPKKYDFRTVELARTLFHISTTYLIKSPLWNNKKFVQTDIERLSYYFEALAESALDKESHEKIKEDEERKMMEDLEKIRREEEFIKYDPKGEWCILNKQYEDCQKKQNSWNQRIAISESKEEIEIINGLLEGIKKTIYKVQDQREASLNDVNERRDKIIEVLSHKYEHLINFFCLYDRLSSFDHEKPLFSQMKNNARLSRIY